MHEPWKKNREERKDTKLTWAKVGERLKNKENRRKMRRARGILRLLKLRAIVRKKEEVEGKLTEKVNFLGKVERGIWVERWGKENRDLQSSRDLVFGSEICYEDGVKKVWRREILCRSPNIEFISFRILYAISVLALRVFLQITRQEAT